MTKVEQVTIPEGYKQTEVGVIPEDWDIAYLADISDKVSVGIASAATHAYRNSGIPFLRNQNIKPNKLDDRDILYITQDYDALFSNKKLKFGDLITARTGYPGTTCIVPREYEGAQSFTTLITRLKQGGPLSEFVCIYMNSESGEKFFELNQIGGGQKNVNAAILRTLPLPLPSKIEQTAIANALSDVDNLIAALETLIAKKSAIKTAAMQQLLTGKKRLPGFAKLSEAQGKKQIEGQAETQSHPQPADSAVMAKTHPTQSVHQHSAPTTDTTTNHNTQTARPGYKHTELGEIPEDWEVRTIGDVALIDPENLGATTEPDYEFNYISLEQVRYGSLLGTNKMNFRNAPSRARRVVKKGDVLVATVRPNLMSHYVQKRDCVDLICSTGFSVVRPDPFVGCGEFLFYHFFAGVINSQIEMLISGSNYPAINSGDVRGLKVTLPPLEEQTAIAKVLSDMDTELDALQQRLEKTQSIKQGMMQELLTGKTRLIKPLEEVVHE